MVEWHHRTRLFRLLIAAVAATTGCLVTACQPSGPRDPSVWWSFEVANEADDRVRVQIALEGFGIPLPWDQEEAGSLVLEVGERRSFRLTGGIGEDSSKDGGALLLHFNGLDFFGEESDVAYRSYRYTERWLDRRSEHPGFGTQWIYRRSDGTEERLFAKSPERPFYLERDTEDMDVGRVVITFVPSAEATAGGAGG